ncbi:glycoside hydrolase family 28 protein [Pontibacter sp. 172403-2]|uniref:glycoside hydrolase family 28 protein n=1 Tax=Pontibacter rufus TaxID=2791028 RepID=UPI0018AF5B4D|nr:glycoside hydrolase family 28 protein [Pontibacter sp. 172403-2]MBF9255050.1 glycoside hydrolase family 28 protein [Pontibacter sp. 172403-2]
MILQKGYKKRLGFYGSIAAVFLFSCQQQPSKPVATTSTAPVAAAQADINAALYQGIEFDMPRVQEPTFANNSVSIVDFGAKGDGITKNTEAFAKAINAVAAKGGGMVVVPPGIWLTGPIVLKSNINLHTEAGSTIIFSADFDDYPLIQTSFEGLNTYRCQSPISGNGLENVAITGQGVIDGSGDAWRPVKKSKMTDSQWKDLVKSGGVLSDDKKTWYPSENSKRGDSNDNFNVPNFTTKEQFESVKDYLRPVMVSLVNCKKVLLDGPAFQNSPAWNLHPLMCEDITLRNLTVRNPWYSQNGDGLDLESCKNAVIYNNSFDVGDDAICIKSGKDKDGRDRGIPTENVIIRNNVVYHGHGGFVVGSEMSGGVKNVHVSDCTFIGTDIGLRFKSTRGRGGVVENIYISNINMLDIPSEAISFNLFYGGNSPILEEDQQAVTEARDETLVPVTEETPSFRNIYMKNITVAGASQAAAFQGLPEMNLQNVRLENAILKAAKGITLVDAAGVKLLNVKVIQENGPALILYNSKDITVQNFSFPAGKGAEAKVMGKLSQDISFDKEDFNSPAAQLLIGPEVPEKAVQLD